MIKFMNIGLSVVKQWLKKSTLFFLNMSIYAKHDKIKQVYFANQLTFGVMSCTAPEQIKPTEIFVTHFSY